MRSFANLERTRRESIAKLLEIEYYPSNTIVFAEGDVGNRFYMVSDGRIAIYQGGNVQPGQVR